MAKTIDGYKRAPSGVVVPEKETILANRIAPNPGKYHPHSINGESELKLAEFCWGNQKAMLMRGPPGCGKTTFAMWFAKEKGAGFYRVVCNEDTTTASFFGKLVPAGDEFRVDWGPVCEAAAAGKAVVLIDDVNLADKRVTASLYSALDYRVLKDEVSGMTFEIPKDVMLMFAMNTGSLYTTVETSPALTRRMGVEMEFDHLPKERCVEMILERLEKAKEPKVELQKRKIAEGLWDGTDELRKAYNMGGMVKEKDADTGAARNVNLPFKEVPGDGLILNVMQQIVAGIDAKVAVMTGMVYQVMSDFAKDAIQKARAAAEVVYNKIPMP